MVIHIRHIAASDKAPFVHPGTKGSETEASVAPITGETVIIKDRPNSFQGTELKTLLERAQMTELTICGAMSQMCVNATVRAAVDLGFTVTLVHDASAAANASFDGVDVPAAQVHAAFMAPLASSYAKMVSTQSCL